MKILMFASFPPNPGGAEQGLWQLCNHLTSRYPDVNIDLIAYQDCPKIKNLHVHHFNLGAKSTALRGIKYMVLAAWKGVMLCRKNGYNAIFASCIYSPGVPAAMVAKIFHKKLIVRTAGTDVRPNTIYSNYLLGFLFPPFINFFQRFVINNSGLIISDAIADYNFIKKKFPKAKVLNLYHGVDSERFSPDSKISLKVRKNLNLKKSDIIIIFVGSPQHRKNLSVILKAAEKLQNAKFLFIGPKKEELQNFGKILNNCIALGRVKDPSIYLSSADIFVLPSFEEGMSNALLEALSTALPAVVYPAGDSGLIVKNNINGFVVGNADDFISKLAVLSKNSKLRQRMGKKSRSLMLKSFSWAEKADKTYALLK